MKTAPRRNLEPPRSPENFSARIIWISPQTMIDISGSGNSSNGKPV